MSWKPNGDHSDSKGMMEINVSNELGHWPLDLASWISLVTTARGFRGVIVKKPNLRRTETKSLLKSTQLITNWVGL